jgi:3'(2'), 5'-bisphosphate nucleotidase
MPEPKKQSMSVECTGMSEKLRTLSPKLVEIAREAGHLIMGYYEKTVSVEIKGDQSPVTEVDIASNKLIIKRLSEITPEIPVVAEESDNTIHTQDMPTLFWLVDPLDGTKSFIKRTGEFTVNIGLVENRRPVMGVVYIPVKKEIYYTGADGRAYFAPDGGAPKKIEARRPPKEGLTVVASAAHRSPETDEYIKTLHVNKFHPASSSLKFCVIARGDADIYPRFGPTMEWDTAAGQAVLEAAGGQVHTVEEKPFLYGKEGFRNGYFIARGKSV